MVTKISDLPSLLSGLDYWMRGKCINEQIYKSKHSDYGLVSCTIHSGGTVGGMVSGLAGGGHHAMLM